MIITTSIGMILLSIYLIMIGITYIAKGFAIPPIVLSVLAIAAGIFILIGR